MYKALIVFSCLFLVTGLSSFGPTASYPDATRTPTAPPPPMATGTKTRLPAPRSTNTPSQTPFGRWATKTPTQTPTPTDTPTLTATGTLTPTLTPSLTPTPFLNLHVVVYLDANQNKLFDMGEGVNDLLLLASSGSWSVQTILQNGEAWLALPPDLVPGSDIQVQSPYLHWSDILRAPKPGETLDASLRLELPQFPVSLP